jgi:uncharacterized protein
MTLTETVTADIATAMKARDAARLTALRMLKAALMSKNVEKRRELEPAEELQVVSSLVKQRRDAIEQFTAGGRVDLAAKEQAEIVVLEGYLPPSLTPDELKEAVDRAITETGASGPKDIGKVMKAVMAILAGRTFDGKTVNELVRGRLS